jgi:two-component system phosphate regulon sensor histidine kinase PhoR
VVSNESLTAFFFGLFLGIAIYFWKQWRFDAQMRRMLSSVSDNPPIRSLATVSLVRREIARLNLQCQQLETELQNWQYLMEVLPLGYLRLDEENQLLWCNQQARELLKIDRWQPQQVRLLLELVRSYELDQLIEETRSYQQPQVKEWLYYPRNYAPGGVVRESTPSGRQGSKSVALRGFSYPLPRNEMAVFLENRQPIVELSQSRDRVFSDLSHELRTPLTAISAVAEMLLSRLKEPEIRWVQQMQKETQRMINLVTDWLDITQLEHNPIQLINYQCFDLRGLIFSVWQSLDCLAQKKKITLNYVGPDKSTIEADTARLSQVFLNLFDNAIKHSPDQGVIEVEVKDDPDQSWVEINVIDCGEGFFPSDLPYIFDRLYRGEKSRTREKPDKTGNQGAGLGLAIVRQILQAHGGSIEARNHPLTGGAWLKIQVPRFLDTSYANKFQDS